MNLEVQNAALIPVKISAMINNPGNFACKLEVIKQYIVLADKAAKKLMQAGRKEEAQNIWLSIASFYNANNQNN